MKINLTHPKSITNELVMTTFEFKKKHRILDRSEFVKLSKYGKRFQDHYFVVIFMPRESECSRLGVTVSRRVGNAVERNRLKRLIREWFRINKSAADQLWDVNVIAKKPSAGLTSYRVFMSLEKIFGNLWGVRN